MDYQLKAPIIPPKPVDNDSSKKYRNYDNIAHTLDNSVLLDQQLETLNHHKRMLEARKMKELLRQNPCENQGEAPIYQNENNSLIYSNIYHQKQPVSYGGGLQIAHGYDREEEDDDDLPPPPSPVSSSYSELARTINNPNKDLPNPGMSEVQKKVQMIQQNQQKLLGNNGKYPMMVHQTGPSASPHLPGPNMPIPVHQKPVSPSSNYSNYESIYEPINPRPPPQHYHHQSHGMYPSSFHHLSGDPNFMSPYNSSAASSLYSQYGMKSGVKEQEVDALTDLLVRSLNTEPSGMCSVPSSVDYDQIPGDLSGENFGICVKCNQRIIGENSGCTAMDQVYHIECFTCCQCQINLQGKPFYPIDNQPFCQEDYLNTLEKCSVCVKPILERILRATGKPYHPQCFCCIVCGKSLDGIPFTVDSTNQIHCIEDFHKKFAPRCCVCRQPIMPEQGKEETVRVVALDRSFHISCYKCEDCGLLLSSEAEGRGCYPLDDHVLCKSCNAKRVQDLTTPKNMTTEL